MTEAARHHNEEVAATRCIYESDLCKPYANGNTDSRIPAHGQDQRPWRHGDGERSNVELRANRPNKHNSLATYFFTHLYRSNKVK